MTVAAGTMFLHSCQKIVCPEPAPIDWCGTDDYLPCEDHVYFVLRDYDGLDGCGWVLENTLGEVYEPTNLGDYVSSPNDGEVVWLMVSSTDMASILSLIHISEPTRH